MWSDALAAWYEENGRHDLPWRRTRDPWAVLVSEVMLQQTSVARVLPRWRAFLDRWPAPRDCARATQEDVLREWQGLGYPRRALALHRAAQAVTQGGWPTSEAGLRQLPGIGAYTARALLAFAFDAEVPPPRDVNLGRVAARAALGVELHETSPHRLDEALAASRPAYVSAREHAFALFDLGATVCTARRPRCAECPLAACASRARLYVVEEDFHSGSRALGEDSPDGSRGRTRSTAQRPPKAPRRQPAYAGSMRQLRGAVLRAMLAADPPRTLDDLRARVAQAPAAALDGAVEEALSGLHHDGLLGSVTLGA